MKLLDIIDSPKDLKKLKLHELPTLVQEVRQEIVSTVSRTGGHLAASLGAVELAIGIHYVFDTPNDVVIWDVGHQAYAHKLLTGRRDNFDSLRQLGGISGFPNKNESPFDPFTTGHGSTSISTALGLAAARDLRQKRNKIVVVIGDGSLVGGMAFEALNHAGHLGKDLVVILNDNEFSIAPSVGALSKYLNKIITNPIYNKIRKDLETLIKKVPKLGTRMHRTAHRLEEGLKNLLVPGIVFEELGFRYFGPIDGHDIFSVVGTLKNLINQEGPIFIHAVTKKGKGYEHAEKLPEKFHGISPFKVESGESRLEPRTKIPDSGDVKNIQRAETYTEAFSRTLVEQAKRNPKIVAITAAMPEGTGLDKFAKKFPNRFFNVGMAEQHAVAFGAGLAKGGLLPVVAIYSTFLQRSYDQIIHDVSLQDLHVVLALDRAGLVGEDGPTHHGVFDIAYLRPIPNMVIMAPKDTIELEAMLEAAIKYKGLVSLRYPRGKPSIPEDIYRCPVCNTHMKSYFTDHRHGREPDKGWFVPPVKIGKAEVLREGKDIALVCIGSMAYPGLEAARVLSEEGIEATVVNGRFAKPLDEGLLKRLASQVGSIITIEEGVIEGGFGSAVLEFLEEEGLQVRIKRMGLPNQFVEHGPRHLLLKMHGLTAESIAETARREARANIGSRRL